MEGGGAKARYYFFALQRQDMQREKGVKRVEKRARKVNTGHLPFFNFKVFFLQSRFEIAFFAPLFGASLLLLPRVLQAKGGREGGRTEKEGRRRRGLYGGAVRPSLEGKEETEREKGKRSSRFTRERERRKAGNGPPEMAS